MIELIQKSEFNEKELKDKMAEYLEVINGFSDLMVEVFGDRGKHARAAVGMGSLPRNIAVEIEVLVELK